MKISRTILLSSIGLAAVFSFALPATAQETRVAANTLAPENIGRAEASAIRPAVNADLPARTDYRTSLSRVGVQTASPVPLSLDEAIRMALSNNNSIELTRADVLIQETVVRSQLGFYDPVFNLTPTFVRNSTTGSAATRDFSLNANMQHFIRPGGGSYQVYFNNSRTENAFTQAQVSSGSIASVGNAAIYTSTSGIRYTQPLFRNFRIDNARRNLKIARRVLEQSDADFRRTTIDTISQVQKTYWDLVFALRDQQNRLANVNLSQENLRQIEARIAAGAAAPLARAEVETELANRESDLLLATQQVSVTENSLKQLLLKDAISAEWTQSYVPTDKPVLSLDTVNLDDAIKDAMANRFELRRLKLAEDINKIDLAYYKDQLKPQINLETNFFLYGLSRGSGSLTGDTTVPLIFGDPSTNANAFLLSQIRRFHPDQTITIPTVTIPASPSYLSGGFNRSLANLFRSDSPNYSIGLTISFPLRNRTAKANLAGARIAEDQIATRIRNQEQIVLTEVRNAVQAVETARQRVLTSRRARENAEIQLEGERKLYEAGSSTTFLLFQRENSLTNARNAEIRAETDYSKALSDLQRVTSTTFRVNNIEVESPTDSK